jgi:C1A family cysteine protease
MPPAHHPLPHHPGLQRDRHDPRDHVFQPRPSPAKKPSPAAIDLRGQCPPVYDQGRINACTANVLAAAVAFSRAKHAQGGEFAPSRLFIYYNERVLQDQVPNDVGASLRDGIRTVKQQGVAPEALWTYDDTPATPPGGVFPADAKAVQKPTDAAFAAATLFEVLSYRRIRNDLAHMKACLAEGYPFALGIQVYPSFMQAPKQQATVTPLPQPGETALGGHAVLAVGYDDQKQWLICRNSWGPEQADGGYFYLPYAYFGAEERVGDIWSVRTVEH